MENQEAAALLMQDVETNLAALQLAGVAATLALALIGVVLSMRAYAVLAEARSLYWQASKLFTDVSGGGGSRVARAASLNASRGHVRRKIRSNRIRGVM